MQHATSIGSGDTNVGLMDLLRGPPHEGTPQRYLIVIFYFFYSFTGTHSFIFNRKYNYSSEMSYIFSVFSVEAYWRL